MIRGPGEPSKPIAGIPIASPNAALPGSALVDVVFRISIGVDML